MMQLPHKLSELAQMALDDVTAMENTPGYVVTMGYWHTTRHLKMECGVCAAGCVISRRLGVAADVDLDSADSFADTFGRDNSNALLAIDCVREGRIQQALDCVNGGGVDRWYDVSQDDHDLSREMADYADDRAQWHLDMAELIADLTAAGL